MGLPRVTIKWYMITVAAFAIVLAGQGWERPYDVAYMSLPLSILTGTFYFGSALRRWQRDRTVRGWARQPWRARFTIRRVAAAGTFTAILLWLLAYPGGVFIACGLGGLAVAFTCWAEKTQRAPSTEFICALAGMIVGAVFTPVNQGHGATNDIRDFSDLFWIIGGAAGGALIGTIGECTVRCILSGRCGHL
jgi:hypothetical protein